MQNQTLTSTREVAKELKAFKAAQLIRKWVHENYPTLAVSAQTRLILECLIELNEEKKFLANS